MTVKVMGKQVFVTGILFPFTGLRLPLTSADRRRVKVDAALSPTTQCHGWQCGRGTRNFRP